MLKIFKKIFLFAGSRKKLLLQSVGISFIGAVFAAFQFWALMLVLEAITAGETGNKTVWAVLGVMLLSIAGRAWASYVSIMKQTETGYGMVIEKRIHIGDRLKVIPMGFFNQYSLGNLTAVVTTSLGDVENSAARALAIIFSGILQSLAMSLAVFFIDVRVGLVVLSGVVCYLAVTEIAQRFSGKAAQKRQQAQEALVSASLEYIQGISVVKAFCLEREESQRINKAVRESCEKNIRLTLASVPWDGLKQMIVRSAGVGIIGCTVWLYLQNSIGLVHCLLLLCAAFMVYSELESAGNMASLLQMLSDSIDKANAVDQLPVMDEKGRDITPENTEIRFEHVSFSYGENKKILDDVSFIIPERKLTAIVGPSGSGKTTLCNLTARFWDVTQGAVRIGGTDVRDYTLSSLLANISMVFQDVYLFQDTVENNIKFGVPKASHEEVVKAAKAACCHEFISRLPKGYDTVIGEGGSTLSGGEKQRISIARAILKDAPIILLDEATANVDPENEAQLQKAIEGLTRDKTIVMIAHRLKTVRNADQILVLDEGKIQQRGTHAELVRQKGIYRDFIQARENAIGWKL